SDLDIQDMQISGFRNTSLRASAKIKGLPDMNKAHFDVQIAELRTGRNDLLILAPSGTIPDDIHLPENLSLNGSFTGKSTVFNTNLELHSNYGTAKAIASYNAGVTGLEKYSAEMNIVDFDVGRLIRQDSLMGHVSMTATVSGEGIDPKTM